MRTFQLSAVLAAAVLAALTISACESGTPAGPEADPAEIPSQFANVVLQGDLPDSGDDDIKDLIPGLFWGDFWVCKGGVQTQFTGLATPSSAFKPTSNPFTVDDGACELVGKAETNQDAIFASVTEIVPAGFQLDSILVWGVVENGNGVETVFEKGFGPQFSDPVPGDYTIAGNVVEKINDKYGCVVIYYNSRIPGGGEGCTPGGWKEHYGQITGNGRSQNTAADWWADTPFATGDEFAASITTDDSERDYVRGLMLQNPGASLIGTRSMLAALDANGGGLNALVRHAAAALLNASSTEVDYDLTVDQVRAQFWAAVNGGDIEGTKNTFQGFNQQGCPQ